MLPLTLLNAAKNSPMLVELKNGDTYNGTLVNCDNYMNISLANVICTSKDGDKFWDMPEVVIRGFAIKYLRIPDEVLDRVPDADAPQLPFGGGEGGRGGYHRGGSRGGRGGGGGGDRGGGGRGGGHRGGGRGGHHGGGGGGVGGSGSGPGRGGHAHSDGGRGGGRGGGGRGGGRGGGAGAAR